MDETSLGPLLDSALAHEPPLGPVVQKSLWAGLRLRRRRRARRAAATVAAVAVIAVAVPSLSGAPGHTPSRPQTLTGPATVFVVGTHANKVIPIAAATNTAGQPITVKSPTSIAFTPDGKTAYVVNETTVGAVTPISVATGKAGLPIRVGAWPDGIAISPDGKTAYVTNIDSDSVTPISTANNRAGPSKSGATPGRSCSPPTGRPPTSSTRATPCGAR